MMNHSVHLRAEGEIGFRSKHPLEPAYSLTLLTNADGKVISSSEKGWGGYCALGTWMEKFGCRRQTLNVFPPFLCLYTSELWSP